MAYKSNLTRKEHKANQIEKAKEAVSGEGLYLYRNASKATLTLPRPTKSGLRTIEAESEFQGDNYYMQLVRLGMLRFVRELAAPKTEEQIMNEQKLLLDQPETVTQQGQVEHVVNQATAQQKVNESGNQPQQAILLNESPSADGFVIVE